VLERAKHVLRCKFARFGDPAETTDASPASEEIPDLLYDPTAYNVAIHVRTGDLQLHWDHRAFWENVWAQVGGGMGGADACTCIR
jgi:hypothetical protein